jgi:hypothetical protein
LASCFAPTGLQFFAFSSLIRHIIENNLAIVGNTWMPASAPDFVLAHIGERTVVN